MVNTRIKNSNFAILYFFRQTFIEIIRSKWYYVRVSEEKKYMDIKLKYMILMICLIASVAFGLTAAYLVYEGEKRPTTIKDLKIVGTVYENIDNILTINVDDEYKQILGNTVYVDIKQIDEQKRENISFGTKIEVDYSNITDKTITTEIIAKDINVIN